jgi:hypothetical protein
MRGGSCGKEGTIHLATYNEWAKALKIPACWLGETGCGVHGRGVAGVAVLADDVVAVGSLGRPKAGLMRVKTRARVLSSVVDTRIFAVLWLWWMQV